MMESPFAVVTPQPELIPRGEGGMILSGSALLFPGVVTQEVLEQVAKDPTIVGVMMKDPNKVFQLGTQLKVLRKVKYQLEADEMFLNRLHLFGGGRPQ